MDILKLKTEQGCLLLPEVYFTALRSKDGGCAITLSGVEYYIEEDAEDVLRKIVAFHNRGNSVGCEPIPCTRTTVSNNNINFY